MLAFFADPLTSKEMLAMFGFSICEIPSQKLEGKLFPNDNLAAQVQ